MKPFKFIGPCDRVRRRGPENEAKWHKMMAVAKPVSRREFLQRVDLTPALDEGETPAQFTDHKDVAFMRSTWGSQPAYFMATHGFEYIFVKGDELGRTQTMAKRRRKRSNLRGTYRNPAAAVNECRRAGAESPGEIYSCALRSMPKTRADAWAREAKRLARAAVL